MLPREMGATEQTTEIDGTSGVSGARDSEDAGKGESGSYKADGGVGSSLPVGLSKMLRRVVGTGETGNLTLTGGTEG